MLFGKIITGSLFSVQNLIYILPIFLQHVQLQCRHEFFKNFILDCAD